MRKGLGKRYFSRLLINPDALPAGFAHFEDFNADWMCRVAICAKNHWVVALVIASDVRKNECGVPIRHNDEDFLAERVFPKIQETRCQYGACDDGFRRFKGAVHDDFASVSFESRLERGEIGCGILLRAFREFFPVDPKRGVVALSQYLQFAVGKSACGDVRFPGGWNRRRDRCIKKLRLEENAPFGLVGAQICGEEG